MIYQLTSQLQTCQLFWFHRRKSVFKPFLPSSGTEAFSSVLQFASVLLPEGIYTKIPFCRFLNFSPTPIFKEVMLIFPFQPSENHYQCSEYKFFLDKLYLKPGPGVESYYCVKLIVIIFWFGGKSSVFKKNLPKISCFQIISSVLERKNLLFSRKSFQKSSVFRWILLVGLLIW